VKKFFAEIDNDEMSAVILRLVMRRRAHEKDKKRIFAWLKRRGFRSDEIARALSGFTIEL
jgi:SOS response regulatory protein OraA/RecX